MKNTIKTLISLMLVIVIAFSLSACNLLGLIENPSTSTENEGEGEVENGATGVWGDATYTEDTTVGTGAKTITVEVSAEDKTVVFTVKTDADTVGDALLENSLIAGEEGAYGLYVKVVNGITADYDVNQCYWAFYIDGGYAMSGVDTTSIEEGVSYKLEYTRG